MRSARALLGAGLLAFGAACAPPDLEFPGRFDYLDAGPSIADAGLDAGLDAGMDAGSDAGPSDAGQDDGGLGDGGMNDGGMDDGGTDDGGMDDAGVDAGPVDAGCNTYARIIVPTCATLSCHSGPEGSTSAGLDLESPDVFSRLIGVSSNEDPTGNLLLIDSVHPDKSFMYLKILPSPPFGARMPFGISPLSADDIACVQQWIHAAVGQ